MNKMNRLKLTLLLCFVAVIVVPVAYAQMGPGPGKRTRFYNPAAETTVKGTVEEVRTVTGRGGWNGIHLTLKAEGKTLDVHVGPAAFLKEKGFTFAKGDQIGVTGAKTQFGGTEAIIAREVKKGSETLVLRDAQGIPEWSGGRRR